MEASLSCMISAGKYTIRKMANTQPQTPPPRRANATMRTPIQYGVGYSENILRTRKFILSVSGSNKEEFNSIGIVMA